MVVDFKKFVDGLSKSELSIIQNDCLQASNRCPQSLNSRLSPQKLDMEVLDFWCSEEILFHSGYKVYLKESTLITLIEYRAYKVILLSKLN
jgi:hypothetical protein